MATRKKTTARKATKKATPRKTAARKAPAKKTAKKAAKKAVKKVPASKMAKKAAKKTVRKAPAKKTTAARKTTAASKATKRTAAAKTAGKSTARKAAKKTPGKVAVKKAGTVTGRTTAVKKATQSARKAPARAPGAPAGKMPIRTVSKATTRPAGAAGVTEEEKSRRRRAARTDAATTIEPADGTSTNFSTATAATPRASDRGTSRTRKPHRITPEEALANTRELLEAKQARDRQPPPWRQLDPEHGQPARDQATPARDAEQEAEANMRAEELHRAESRLDAIQGSVSQQDRHQQGRRDAKE